MDKILERAQGDIAARGRQGRTKRSEGDGSGVSNKQIEAYMSQVCRLQQCGICPHTVTVCHTVTVRIVCLLGVAACVQGESGLGRLGCAVSVL